jgi:hypothetical protein
MNRKNAKNESGIDLKDPKSFFSWMIDSIDRALVDIHSYSEYQADPIGFSQDILGESYTDEVKILMESVRDYPVTIAISATGTGKTHAAARVAIWFYKTHDQSKVFTAAAPPIDNLETLLWGEIGNVVRKHKKMFVDDYITYLNISSTPPLSSKTLDDMEDEEEISFIKGVTIPTSGTSHERESKFSGKHAPNMLFIFDEGDAVPDEVYKGADGCMSGGHVRMLIMFNPKSQVGEAYRKIRDGRANVVYLSAFGHPNVITGEDVIPGAVTRETTVRRVNEWCRPLVGDEQPDSECFDLPDFLVGSVAESQAGKEYPPLKSGHYKIIEPSFSYMVLGRYPAKGVNQLISTAWVARARSRYDAYVSQNGQIPPVGVSAVMGVDVGEFGSDENVSCFRYGGYTEFILMPGGVDTMETGDNATIEFKKRNTSIAHVDATGVGAGVAPHMQRNGCSATPVKVASSPTETTELGEFYILRDQLWWACREWLRTDPGAMLPRDELLIEELQTPTYEVTNGKIRVMKKDFMRELLRRSPDRADSLCLTFAPFGFFSECDLS